MSASRNICENEIELLIQAMNQRFQSDPSLNESDIDENDLLKENSNQFTDENIFSINFTKVDNLRRFIYYSLNSKKTLENILLKIKVRFV